MSQSVQHVDVAFSVKGPPVPRDHAYTLYGALCRHLPEIHGAKWISIQGLNGRPIDGESISLEAGAVLRMRIPIEKIGVLVALAGARLEVAGRILDIGAPTVRPLTPAATLDARLVVIRLTHGVPKPFDAAAFERRFLAEATRQLVALDVRGQIGLSGRQSMSVGGQRILGYAMRVGELSADDSLRLQIRGIGGKRTMGCGVFRAARVKVARARAA